MDGEFLIRIQSEPRRGQIPVEVPYFASSREPVTDILHPPQFVRQGANQPCPSSGRLLAIAAPGEHVVSGTHAGMM